MLNVAFRIVGNIADAEDVLQESFLDAFSKVKDFRQETTFGLWLKQIVVNRSVNLLRKRKVEWVELGENELDGIADEVIDNDDEIQYQVAIVKQAMNKLPEGYRVVLSLYLLEGYDHEEIAYILGITESTSRSQLARGKKKLLELLKEGKNEKEGR